LEFEFVEEIFYYFWDSFWDSFWESMRWLKDVLEFEFVEEIFLLFSGFFWDSLMMLLGFLFFFFGILFRECMRWLKDLCWNLNLLKRFFYYAWDSFGIPFGILFGCGVRRCWKDVESFLGCFWDSFVILFGILKRWLKDLD